MIDIENCDLNDDYFHFTNIANIESIMIKGLLPAIGPASQMVNDRANVSVSLGAKGIMGIINSFIYMFSALKIREIPNEYRKYFPITDFDLDDEVGMDLAYEAVANKLKDEVYFKVDLSAEDLKNARIGGLTDFDINLPTAVDRKKVNLVTKDGKLFTAFDVASYIYSKAKDIEIFRTMNEDFFKMIEKNNEEFTISGMGI